MSNLAVNNGFGQIASVFQADPIESELGGGISTGYSILSNRQGRWYVKSGGQEIMVTKDGNPVLAVDVVILKASATKCKTYYAGGYDANAVRKHPDCWSNDAMRPDPSVQNPVSASCLNCKFDIFGSKVTDSGSKTKMCSDYKRTAVIFVSDLFDQTFGPMLYRVPAGSLTNLANYEKYLKTFNAPYYGVHSRIGQDLNAKFSKMAFTASRPLNEDEARAVIELRNGDVVGRIVAESAGGGGSLTPFTQPQMPVQVATPVTPSRASQPKVAKPTLAAALAEQPAPTPKEFDESLKAALDGL